ncbi:MAG: hypothetical protein M3O46_08190 [Myxococcota bacterium]|nr:hypothetical protein [Myxococcota bacterium]
MKTTTIRKISNIRPDSTQTDAQREADFDGLVTRATRGDRRALAAIAIALSPRLLEEARAVMGAHAQDAGDVLQEFFLMLLEGRTQFTPAHGRGIAWMCGIVRAMARRHRAQRARDLNGRCNR